MFETPYRLVPLSTIVGLRETRDPRKSPDDWFDYVDISAVSNSTYSIIGSKRICGADAPSRARKVMRTGDVIFATTRPYLKAVAAVPEEFEGQLCSTGFCVLRPSDRIISEWLFYCVISEELQQHVKPLMRGATYPAITDKDVLDALVPLPPISEQLRVVARIRECMERVDEIQALRHETEKEAQALTSAVFADYIVGLGDAERPEIVLGDVVTNCTYGTSTKANIAGRGLPVLRMGNIKDGSLDTADLKHVELPYTDIAKYLLEDGDILVNRTNSLELVGKSAEFTGLDGQWVYASYLVRLRIDRTRAVPAYINAAINSRIGRDYVSNTARRAIGMVNINAKEIQRMPLPLPPLSEQVELVQRMDEAAALIDGVRAEIQASQLTYLRDAILRKAFAGEL